MENQHRHIKGYRELSRDEIELMNKIKAKGEELDNLLYEVREWNKAYAEQDGVDAADLVQRSEANRWTSIAKTDFQTGLMALIRAVAKPESF